MVFKSTTRARLPFKDAPGTLTWCNDSRELFLYSIDGNPCPINDILSLKIVEQPGRDGKDGRDGVDGINGKDGAQGPRGEKGERGDVLYVGPAEVKAAADELRRRKALVLALIEKHREQAKAYPHGTKQILQSTLNISERELK